MTSNMRDYTTVEATGQTADIIPFPVQSAREAAASEVTPPEVRLVRAIESLRAALAEQAVAMAAWRYALGQLKVSTAGLNDSLLRYGDNLAMLEDGVLTLRGKALALQGWAERAERAAD